MNKILVKIVKIMTHMKQNLRLKNKNFGNRKQLKIKIKIDNIYFEKVKLFKNKTNKILNKDDIFKTKS